MQRQTKGLSLEEIGGRFGDEVVVHLTDENARLSQGRIEKGQVDHPSSLTPGGE